MKKAISFSVIVLVLLLIYQVGINFIKKEHSVQYNVENESDSYKIEEDYSYENNDTYLIRVTDSKNNSFVFDVKNNYNKQREIALAQALLLW